MSDHEKPKVQGEGDYQAARRYRKSARQFAGSGKIESAAKDAEPHNERERTEMEAAEREGLRHSKAKGE